MRSIGFRDTRIGSLREGTLALSVEVDAVGKQSTILRAADVRADFFDDLSFDFLWDLEEPGENNGHSLNFFLGAILLETYMNDIRT